jgi:hypothetical protein
MKMEILSRKLYFVLVIFILISAMSFISPVSAEIKGPGWFDVKADPVSPADAQAYYASKGDTAAIQGAVASASAAAAVTDEIKELARGLQYDPVLILHTLFRIAERRYRNTPGQGWK